MKSKKELRKEINKAKAAITEEEICSLSEILTERLLSTEEFINAGTLLIYMSADQEVRTEDIIRKAWTLGKTVAVPRVMSETEMEFFCITDFENMTAGYGGISEPRAEEEKIADPHAALMIMPGLAFDRAGNRLGHGKGYYDLYLDKHRDAGIFRIALCYDFQLVSALPAEEWDERADIVITPSEEIRIK